jgi:hypothetical protein
VAKRSPLQQHGKGRTGAYAALLAVLTIVAGYLVFEFGRIQAEYNIVDAAKERRSLEETIAGLENEIAGLRDQIAVLETHRDIEREAYKEVEANLTSLQTKIQEQRDAIAFYRGIVSPADGKSGLRVQDLRLTRGAEERQYNIRLVLVQAKKHDRKVSGDVSLSIVGDLDGVETSIAFADLLPEGADKGWKFSFRYFQDFDRQVVLPDGFTPTRIHVAVESKTRSIASIEESFSWSSSQG